MILVTGATGYVGRQVVRALTSDGHPTRALVHSPPSASVITQYDAENVEGDVLDPESLKRACEGVDGVIHLVAVVRERGAMTYRRVNYDGTRNVLDAAEAAGVSRIVYASTLGASSDPGVPYLYSRWMAEQEVVRNQIDHTVVRFSVGFGDGDEFFTVLAALVKLFPLVPVAGDGAGRFQPIAVEDVARCLVAAYEDEHTVGKTIEAGGPEYYTYDEILDLIADVLGARIAKAHLPLGLMMPMAAIIEALAPRPPVTRDQLKMLRIDSTTDLDSVEKTFGFVPRSLRSGIGYLSRIGLGDAIRMSFGFMPAHIRDH